MNKKGEGTLVKYVTATILVFFFALGIIMYVSNFSSDNDISTNITGNSFISDINSSMTTDADTFMIEVETNENVSKESTLSQGGQATNTGNQFRFSNFKNTMSSIFKGANTYLFGNNPLFAIFLSVIGAFLVFLAVMYIYKAWIGGQPD